MAGITVISGAERRRRWNDEQKRAVVAAAFAPGAIVSEVARRADLMPGQIYRWRAELAGRQNRKGPTFSKVVVALPDPVSAVSAEVVVVELAGAVVRLSAAAPPSLVTAILNVLSR